MKCGDVMSARAQFGGLEYLYDAVIYPVGVDTEELEDCLEVVPDGHLLEDRGFLGEVGYALSRRR